MKPWLTFLGDIIRASLKKKNLCTVLLPRYYWKTKNHQMQLLDFLAKGPVSQNQRVLSGY